MNKTIFFCLPEDFQCLLLCDIVTIFLCFNNIISHITYRNTPSFRIIAASFIMCQTRSAAGTWTCCIFTFVFTQPVGNMFQINGLIFHFNCLFNRNDMHTDTCSAFWNKWCNLFKRQTGHMFKEDTHFRIGFKNIRIHIEEFCTSRHIHRQDILLFRSFILPVIFQNTFN